MFAIAQPASLAPSQVHQLVSRIRAALDSQTLRDIMIVAIRDSRLLARFYVRDGIHDTSRTAGVMVGMTTFPPISVLHRLGITTSLLNILASIFSRERFYN